MARTFVLAALLVRILSADVVDDAMAVDKCDADTGNEECSLSLRQLRGEWKGHEVKLHNPAPSSDGFCCFAGSSIKDTCGTCYAEAVAKDENCTSEDGCRGCGGSWCATSCFKKESTGKREFYPSKSFCTQSESKCTGNCHSSWGLVHNNVAAPVVEDVKGSTDGFCCFSASSIADTCGTCYPESIASGSNFSSADVCNGSGGTWCSTGCAISAELLGDSLPAGSKGTKPVKQKFFGTNSYCAKSEKQCSETCKGSWTVLDRSVKMPVVASINNSSFGFCCYAGSSTTDTCGTCYPEARITSENCSTASSCGSCGGTWCSMGCAADAKHPSHGFHPPESLCGQSEENCNGTCKSSWAVADLHVPARTQKRNATTLNTSVGFCCYDSKSSSDTCGTCYPTAIATDDTCTLEEECSGCGGTWCVSTCVASADGCNAKAPVFESTSFCSQTQDKCEDTCHGSWCAVTGKAKTKKSESEEGSGDDTKTAQKADGEAAESSDEDGSTSTTPKLTTTKSTTTNWLPSDGTEAERAADEAAEKKEQERLAKKNHKKHKHHKVTDQDVISDADDQDEDQDKDSNSN